MSKKNYEQAKANTFGVGMACFSTERDQERAFNKAFTNEALTARTYISELEASLVRAREALTLLLVDWDNDEAVHDSEHWEVARRALADSESASRIAEDQP